jgi:hypothetical protein
LADPQRYHDLAGPGQLDLGFGLVAWVPAQLLVEIGELRVRGGGDTSAQPAEHLGPPLAQVHDPWRQAGGVQAHPQHIGRWYQQLLGRSPDKQHDAGAGVDHVPPSIHRNGRVRLVHGQHLSYRSAYG